MNQPNHAGDPTRIAPQTGTAFRIRKGQVLRIIDPMGEQVSDLFSVSQQDPRCTLSSGRSLAYSGHVYPSQCHPPSAHTHLIPPASTVSRNPKAHAGGPRTVDPPLSRAGDHVDLRAEMDMVCGLTACSAEGSNNGTFKPIEFAILDAPIQGL